MSDFTVVKVTADLSAKTAQVAFTQPYDGTRNRPIVMVMNVPWDVPGEQTESEINKAAIENAKALLRSIG